MTEIGSVNGPRQLAALVSQFGPDLSDRHLAAALSRLAGFVVRPAARTAVLGRGAASAAAQQRRQRSAAGDDDSGTNGGSSRGRGGASTSGRQAAGGVFAGDGDGGGGDDEEIAALITGAARRCAAVLLLRSGGVLLFCCAVAAQCCCWAVRCWAKLLCCAAVLSVSFPPPSCYTAFGRVTHACKIHHNPHVCRRRRAGAHARRNSAAFARPAARVQRGEFAVHVCLHSFKCKFQEF
jgi:hypothetical protein